MMKAMYLLAVKNVEKSLLLELRLRMPREQAERFQ